MSNKTQLQTNNTALDACIARINVAKNTASQLPDAGGSGGDNSLSAAAGEWMCVVDLPTTYAAPPMLDSRNYYIELPENVNYVLFSERPVSNPPISSFVAYWKKQSLMSDTTIFTNTSTTFTINDVSTDGVKILEIWQIDNEIANALWFLPIYNIS